MEAFKVEINGTSYPCRMTMGAMLRFKRQTGKEVTEVTMDSLSDLAVLLWCCVASACNADKVEFKLGLEDFCDSLSEAQMLTMTEVLQGDGEPAGSAEQKKSPTQ